MKITDLCQAWVLELRLNFDIFESPNSKTLSLVLSWISYDIFELWHTKVMSQHSSSYGSVKSP